MSGVEAVASACVRKGALAKAGCGLEVYLHTVDSFDPEDEELIYSQATVDTLRAQLEAAEARHAATERDACRQAEQTNEWKSRAEAAEAECARLRHAGSMLASCAFNLAQRNHLTDDERRSLDLSRTAWDAARTKEQQA